MRVVLYSSIDLEPIIVLSLEDYAWEYIESIGEVTIPVIEPIKLCALHEQTFDLTRPKSVRIEAHTFYWNGVRKWLLVTSDEESALLLSSAFLPGQYRLLHEHERKSFAEGFLEGLRMLGDIL